MNIRNTFTLLFLTCTFLMLGCDENEPMENNNLTNRFYYYFDYSNPTGVDPTVGLTNNEESSPFVRIDPNAIVNTANFENQAQITFNNVSVINEDGANAVIYGIDSLAVEFFVDGKWILDTEFEYFVSSNTDLDVVVVLDKSTSLAGDFPQIQSFANSFIEDLFNEIPDVEVGVVDFATNFEQLPLTNTKELVQAYINGIDQDQFTRLYEAMLAGIEMLENSDGTSKAMLTFTDGIDNQSAPDINPEFLNDRLVNNPNNAVIASYTIGLGETINETALRQLAFGGDAQFPKNLVELETAFKGFSSSITTLHSLVYRRNQQVITTPIPCRFVIWASPK